MSFSPLEDEKLVEFVSKYPVLYDASVAGYKDAVMRENIWKEIGLKLNKPDEDCKKRWKSQRDSYFRCRNKDKKGTGSAATKSTKWHPYDRLTFLNVVLRERNTISSVKEQTQDNYKAMPPSPTSETADTPSTQEQPIPSTSVESSTLSNQEELSPSISAEITKPAKAIKKRKNNDNNQHNELILLMKRREEQRQKDMDNLTRLKTPIETFGEHVKTVLNGLPPAKMIEAKTEIFNTLTKFELKAAGINSPSTPGSEQSILILSPSSSVSSNDVNTTQESLASNLEMHTNQDPQALNLHNITNISYLDYPPIYQQMP